MDELLKQISENPDSIEELSRDQAQEAKQALAQFVADIKAGEVEADSEAIAEARTLTDAITARLTVLEEAQAAQDAALAELEASLGLVEEVEEEEVEIVEVPEAEEVEVEEPEVVMASAPSIGRVAASIPTDRKPREEPMSLVASVSGPRQGERFYDTRSFGQFVVDTHSTLSHGQGDNGKHYLASVPTKHKHTLNSDPEHNLEVFAAIRQEASATVGFDSVLTASGGFCAPAEVLYEFFNIATRAGLIQLPTVNASRGAITYPISPSLGDFIGEDGIGGQWCNDTDTDPGTATKLVFRADCPEQGECEVCAFYTILEFGNFAARFYPEFVANTTSLALVAAARVVNAAAVTALTGFANQVTANDFGGGGIVEFYRNINQRADAYRNTYGMAPDAVLDVVAPSWVPRALAADAVARDATTDYGDVRRHITGMLAESNVRAQFVYDYQDNVGEFPTAASVFLFAPGTVVQLDAGTLNLGVVRDSILNSTNDYQTFVEDFVGWCQPGHEVVEIEDIPVCADGSTGARDILCAT